jgi:hypothetical protein
MVFSDDEAMSYLQGFYTKGEAAALLGFELLGREPFYRDLGGVARGVERVFAASRLHEAFFAEAPASR